MAYSNFTLEMVRTAFQLEIAESAGIFSQIESVDPSAHLGNPGGQDLWRWTLGEFLNDHGDFLHIQSDVFGGNSGGPVLNKQGILLGIIARSDRHMNALAIPARDINRLLSESWLEHSRSHR